MVTTTDHLTCRQAGCCRQHWADFCTIINKTTLDLTWGYFFGAQGFRADRETTLLLTAAFLSILLLPSSLTLWCLVRGVEDFCTTFGSVKQPYTSTTRSGVQSSLPPPSPFYLTLSPPLSKWGGALWPGEHWQHSRSQTMTSSLQDWQAMRACLLLAHQALPSLHA